MKGGGSCLSLPVSVSSASSGQSGKAKGALLKWSPGALAALFYYMRCSQLEHGEAAATPDRPYLVLPPLAEYLRVAAAHAQHRAGAVVEAEDVRQAARLLLPHLDLPPAPFAAAGVEDAASLATLPASLLAGRRKRALGFALLATGRGELVPEALEYLGPRRINTLNEQVPLTAH